MPRRVISAAGLLTCALLSLGFAESPAKAPKATPAGDVFGPGRVWQFHLEIAASEWTKMQPVGGMRFPGMPGNPPQPAEPNPERHRSVFGMEFPWAHAELTAEGKTSKNV